MKITEEYFVWNFWRNKSIDRYWKKTHQVWNRHIFKRLLDHINIGNKRRFIVLDKPLKAYWIFIFTLATFITTHITLYLDGSFNFCIVFAWMNFCVYYFNIAQNIFVQCEVPCSSILNGNGLLTKAWGISNKVFHQKRNSRWQNVSKQRFRFIRR